MSDVHGWWPSASTPKVTGGGGGGPGPGGTIGPWGPDFGQAGAGEDITFRVGVATALGDLALTGQLGVGVATQVTSLVAPFVTPMGVGVATAMPQVALAGQLGVGVQTHMTQFELRGTDLGVGVQTRMPTLALAGGALGVGVSTRGTALGAPFVVGTPTTYESVLGSAAPITLALPAGTVEGDLLIAFLARTGGGGITAPAGWTLIQTRLNVDVRITAFSRVASASEPASYNFNAGGANAGMMLRVIGYDLASGGSSVGDVATEINPTPPSMTTTAANCMVFTVFGQAETLDPSYTPPAGHVEYADLSAAAPLTGVHALAMGVSSRIFAATGSTGGFTWTKSGGTPAVGVETACFTFAVRPGTVTLA